MPDHLDTVGPQNMPRYRPAYLAIVQLLDDGDWHRIDEVAQAAADASDLAPRTIDNLIRWGYKRGRPAHWRHRGAGANRELHHHREDAAMTDAEPHTELDAHEPRPPQLILVSSGLRVVGTFEARFHGKCASCGERIVPGDSCRFAEDDGGVVHVDCDAAVPEEIPAKVCPLCWLTSCDCEDAS